MNLMVYGTNVAWKMRGGRGEDSGEEGVYAHEVSPSREPCLLGGLFYKISVENMRLYLYRF